MVLNNISVKETHFPVEKSANVQSTLVLKPEHNEEKYKAREKVPPDGGLWVITLFQKDMR